MSVGLLSAVRGYIKRIRGRSTEAVLTRRAGSSLIVNGLGTIAAFGLQVFLARRLGALEYGQYIYAQTWLAVLVVLCKFGLDTASLRLLPQYFVKNEWPLLRGYTRRSSQFVLGFSTVVALAMSGIVSVSHLGWTQEFVQVFYLAAIALPLTVYLALQCACLQAFQFITWAQAPQVILRPVLTAGLVFLVITVMNLGSARSAMGCYIASTVIVMALVSLAMRRLLPHDYYEGQRTSELTVWLSIAAPMLIITGFDILLNQVDILIVGALLTAKEAGIYSAVTKITLLVPMAIIFINAVTAPVIAQLYAQHRKVELQRLISRVAWGSFAISVPLCLVIAIYSEWFLRLFGPAFVVGKTAMLLLLGGRLMVALTGSVGYLMSMSGHQNQAAVILGATTVMDIALCSFLVPRFGINGAAIATAAALGFWSIVMVIYAFRMTGINATILPANSGRSAISTPQ